MYLWRNCQYKWSGEAKFKNHDTSDNNVMKSVVNQTGTISNDDTNSQITKKKQLVFFITNIFGVISVF